MIDDNNINENIPEEENNINENIPEKENNFEDMEKYIKPMCNYLLNNKLNNSLNQYKDTEIASMEGGFCVSRGYLTPIPASQIIEDCSDQIEYSGYISSIRAREYKTEEGNIVYRIRVVCHLIVENKIAEFYTEFPSTISPTSRLTSFLITMGVPVFNFPQHSIIDLDYWLKDRNIAATLQRYEKNEKVYYYLNKISPRIV